MLVKWGRGAIVVAVSLVGCLLGAGGNSAATAPYETACWVPPRSFEEIQRLRETEASDETVRTWEGAGVRVTSTVQLEIEGLVRAFLACSGAGEPLRVWSLYSDSYLARSLDRERGYDRARYEMDLLPRPLETGAWPELRRLFPAMTLGDNRVVVSAIVWYPNLAREKDLVWSFIRIDGEWKIDEIDGEITFAVP